MRLYGASKAELDRFFRAVKAAEKVNVSEMSLLQLWNDFLQRIDGEDPKSTDGGLDRWLDEPIQLLERMRAETHAASSRAYGSGCAIDFELRETADKAGQIINMLLPPDRREPVEYSPLYDDDGELIGAAPADERGPADGKMHIRIAIYLGVAFGLMQAGAVICRHTKGARKRVTQKSLDRTRRRSALYRYAAEHGPIPPVRKFGKTNPERTRYYVAFKRKWGADFSRDTFNRDAAYVEKFPIDPVVTFFEAIDARNAEIRAKSE